MSMGKSLLHITYRDRWLLFSTAIEVPENAVKLLPPPVKQDENAIFDNDFFKNARPRPAPAESRRL